MSLRHLSVGLRRRCRASLLFQVGLMLAFWLAGEATARAAGLFVPGSIVGLFLVLALLASKRLSIWTVRRGAHWFLAEMLLFFVPAVLAVLDHPELMGLLGVKVLVVVGLSTLIVMVVTAGVVDICYRMSDTGKGYVDDAQ